MAERPRRAPTGLAAKAARRLRLPVDRAVRVVIAMADGWAMSRMLEPENVVGAWHALGWGRSTVNGCAAA